MLLGMVLGMVLGMRGIDECALIEGIEGIGGIEEVTVVL
jgi:hypothetical protein